MQMPMPMPGHEGHDVASAPLDLPAGRDGSGTSWTPDSTPVQGLMHQTGAWMLMLHGHAFLQFIDAGGDRGSRQVGSINWVMGMAERDWRGGRVKLHAMASLEPLTVGRCGYPDLLQSGEACRGVALHDRQHPHDLLMELAVDYRRPLSHGLAFEVYGGPVGEPALGPTAYPHRSSAMPNPMAPIAHHWLDSTHVSFGVVTGGLYGRRWKAEASVFNGREPDDRRYDLDLGALDSYSARLSLAPTSTWALQVSGGHLADAEADVATGHRENVDRLTASATYLRVRDERVWASTVAWGLNHEHGLSSSAFTVETALDVTPRDAVFGRAELVGKTSAELGFEDEGMDARLAARLEAGYTRWLADRWGLRVGMGGSIGLAFVPSEFEGVYGGRHAGQVAVFGTIRPQ
jgi:hypothetical protein